MVMNLLMAVFGPLAGPECRRALARGWVIVVRSLVAGVPALLLLGLIWSWWLAVRLEPKSSPSSAELQFGLTVTLQFMFTIAMVMTPAVLAGSLAGERERGVLHHLLVTAVSPREIVAGRLAGKLSQVGMVLLAAIPLLILLAGWNDLDLSRLATLAMLMAAVLVGGGGLAVGASVLARRGRDALLGAYLVILVLLLIPMVTRWGLASMELDWLDTTNPFLSLGRLVWDGELAPALATSGLWSFVGLLGTVLASWRLLPSCLASDDQVKRSGRRRGVPPLGERPMLWKELFIERAGTLGRLGQWLGLLIIVPLGGASIVLAAIAAWCLFVQGDAERSEWSINGMSGLLHETEHFLGWMIQWAIGLRAAVSIATERERGTWEGLLASRLEPGEIVYAKLYGSLFALRWLLGTILLAWTLGLAVGAIRFGEYANWMVETLSSGILMAAVGVRCSLSLPTATKAMTWTIALWLGGLVVVAVSAGAIICIGILAWLAVWSAGLQMGLISPTTTLWFPMGFPLAWILSTNGVIFLLASLIILDTRLRFDRIAGRMTEGTVAVTMDGWLHGRGARPVLLGDRPRKPVNVRALPIHAAPSDDLAV
jgi:ABC-type Na+ efflux pump permease subunit